MNRNIGLLQLHIMAVLITLTVIGVFIFALHQAAPKDEPSSDAFSNLCYWKTIQPGQGITGNGPGEFEYTLIMTANGIDVYLPCQ